MFVLRMTPNGDDSAASPSTYWACSNLGHDGFALLLEYRRAVVTLLPITL